MGSAIIGQSKYSSQNFFFVIVILNLIILFMIQNSHSTDTLNEILKYLFLFRH